MIFMRLMSGPRSLRCDGERSRRGEMLQSIRWKLIFHKRSVCFGGCRMLFLIREDGLFPFCLFSVPRFSLLSLLPILSVV